MAAPLVLPKVLCRLKLLSRSGAECKRYVKTAATEVMKETDQQAIPWEKRPDGIVIMKEHAPFVFKFEDALNMHKEAAQPSMSQSPDTSIYADMILDFTSKKVTKPMKHYVGLIRFPHKFDYRQEKKFMVFSQSDETLELAKSLGAHVYGGLELIERLVMGRVHKDDIQTTDFVLATPDIYPKMPKLKAIFKMKFPSEQTETIGDDIKGMMENLKDGLRYTTDKNVIDEFYSRVQIPFGQLNQEEEKLSENFEYLVQHFLHKKGEKLSSHIKEISLVAPPSEERFLLNMDYIKRKEIQNIDKSSDTVSQAEEETVQELDEDPAGESERIR